jgi:hypothetical protein
VKQTQPKTLLLLVLSLMLAFAGRAAAKNLVVNGDFSQPLETGWTVKSSSEAPTVEVRTEKTNSVRVYQMANGYTSLRQRVAVPNGKLRFSFSGWFSADVNKPDFGAMSNVTIAFLDADTNLLGQTTYARIIGESPLPKNDNTHIIPVKADSVWSDYSFNVGQELAKNLGEIDPEWVKYVDISLNVDNGTLPGC